MYTNINSNEFKNLFNQSFEQLEIIDVRQPEEFNQIKIKWSKLVPLQDLGAYLDKIDWSKKVIFVCRTWSRSEYVSQVLSANGYDSINLAGGIKILQFNCQECIESWHVEMKYFE